MGCNDQLLTPIDDRGVAGIESFEGIGRYDVS